VLPLREVAHPASPEQASQIGALTDLYFAVTSVGGKWSIAGMATWRREVGLHRQQPFGLFTAPACDLQAAVKRQAQKCGGA